MNAVSAPFEAAVDTLQAHLIDLVDLTLLSKQAHWNVVGPNFRPIHEHLDEIADFARNAADETAERINALQAFPDGQARDVAEHSQLEPWPSGPLKDHVVVDGMTQRMAHLGQRTRERIESLDPEPGSQDLLIAQLQELEKHTWMMRAQAN